MKRSLNISLLLVGSVTLQAVLVKRSGCFTGLELIVWLTGMRQRIVKKSGRVMGLLCEVIITGRAIRVVLLRFDRERDRSALIVFREGDLDLFSTVDHETRSYRTARVMAGEGGIPGSRLSYHTERSVLG